MASPKHFLPILVSIFSIHLSAQTYMSGMITENTTWNEAASPYVITDSLIVQAPAVLTLEAGTKIMFNYHPEPSKKSYMVVNGGIISEGNFEKFVVFTSFRDDSEGDLNGDSTATMARPGDWGYIQFNNPDPVWEEQQLGFVIFKYGGGRNPDTLTNPDLYPMVSFRDKINDDGYTIWVNDCDFVYSKGTGIRMGSAELYNSRINNCVHGILLTTSNCALLNSSIQANKDFPILFNGLKIVIDHSIADSNDDHYFIENFQNNTLSNNGQNYFAMGGNVKFVKDVHMPSMQSIKTEWRKISIPYLVTTTLRFYGTNINIWEGTLVKFKYHEDNIMKPSIWLGSNSSMATVYETGTESTVFTSEFDHRYDYEPFSGAHRDPMVGDWGYIQGSNFDLENCVFKHGGLYADPLSGEALSDSSAALRVRAGVSGATRLTDCLFNNMYGDGILVLFEQSVDHPMNITGTSFLLSKRKYGIRTMEPEGVNAWSIDARNNYWYGKQGPFNPTSNPDGNGCRIDDNITFLDFLTKSDDELELVSSVIRGTARNLEGMELSNALVQLKGKNERSTYSKSDGSYYISNVYPGYGYTMHLFAARHRDTIYENMQIFGDTTHLVDFYMRERTIDYLVDTITFKVNPDESEIQAGGTAYRYYKIIDRITHDPVYGAEVFVEGLVDTFYTNYKGIAPISIPWNMVNTLPSGTNFYISLVGLEALPYPPDQRINFRVKRLPRDYTKMWGGKLWLKEGISIIELKQEVGASIGVVVEDPGSGEEAKNLLLERGFKAGGGINLGAAAKVTLGPVKAGAEAEIGVNLNALLKDQFIFDYSNNEGRIALAKFIVLAGSAFQYLDSPLHRYLGVALLDNNPYVQEASYSNSVGLNYHGFAGANATLGLTLKDSDGKEAPIGAELKGSADAKGNIDFLFTSYTHSDQLDFKLSYAAEIGLGASAGVGFDIAELFGGGDEKDKNDKDKKDKEKKDDNELEIKIPDLLSASANAGIRYGASISTTRSVPEPYSSLGFMYGYKYAAGASAFNLFGAGVGQDREYHFTFDFHDAYLKGVLEEKVQLAKEIATNDMSNLSLDISSLSAASIFRSPLATFAAEQTKNAFSFPPIPYHQTVTDLLDQGEFAVEISFGIGPVKAKFGAGIEYTEANDYLWRSGVFYDWGLYPLQAYDYVADNNTLQVGTILQDILYESGEYLWEQIKQAFIPPIFRKLSFWPFNILKSTGGPYFFQVGPETRSSVLVVDTFSVDLEILDVDSLRVYYWDWYGTKGISDKKSSMNAEDLKILEHVKSKAVEVHKLDYGIGGFYQFEPNGTVIADSAMLTINYHNDELNVLLEDGSEYTIDESKLRIYVEDKTHNKWIYLGGVANADNNTVTARIDSLGTFTLAPFIPDGEITLTADPDAIRIDVSDTTEVTSSTIYYNTGQLVEDEEFTIEVSRGTITTTDEDPNLAGVQVKSDRSGRISFTYQSDSISGIAYLKAKSLKGGAEGIITVAIYEKNPPQTPVITSVTLEDYSVELIWDPVPDLDLAYYKVYFWTSSGPRYYGTASVLGDSSPVKTGTTNSLTLEGLYKDSTYFFAVKAFDRVGNGSDYSATVELTAQFNHRPVIYSRVFKVDPVLPEGTVIDTLWADDEDREQELRYYLASNNICTAFDLDPVTGVLSVKDAAQLDYWITGVDTFIMQVGVRDNADIPSADSTVIRIFLNMATGMRRAPLPHEPLFRLYPNPATNELNIDLNDKNGMEAVSISLVNLQGQTTLRKEIDNGSGRHIQLNLAGIPPGVYSVVLQTIRGRSVQRLLLMR